MDAPIDFHSGVVGWEGGTWERPDGEYPVFLMEGQIRGGLVPIEEGGAGWAPYVGVADLRATLARTRSLGGPCAPAGPGWTGRDPFLAPRL